MKKAGIFTVVMLSLVWINVLHAQGYLYEIEENGKIVNTITASDGDLIMTILGDEPGFMLFDSKRKAMKYFDPKKMAVMTMDKKKAKEMADQMAKQFGDMEKQMKKSSRGGFGGLGGLLGDDNMKKMMDNLPEDKRKELEAMMKGEGASAGMPGAAGMPGMPGEKAPKEYMENGNTGQTPNGINYKEVDVKQGDKKLMTLYIADEDDVVGGKELAATFKNMSEVVKDITETFTNQMGMGGFGQQFDDPFMYVRGGVVVGSRDSDGTSTYLSSAKSGDYKVEAPKGNYKEMDLMEMSR